MRSIVLPLGIVLLAVGLSGCIPSPSAPVMDQADASCFVDGDAAVLMLPVQVGGELGLTELELIDPEGLGLVGFTAIQTEDEPFATDRPPTSDDLDAMMAPGPADPPITLSAGKPYWLVAVASTDDGGGSAAGLRLSWDDDSAQDANLPIDIGSVCSM